jgi:hydrogenase maturation protease
MSIRILCLGNEMACDDGIGIRVGRVLRTLPLSPDLTIELRPGVGLELLDTLHAEETLVLVDAMRTGHLPGECRVLDASQSVLRAQSQFCCHGVGVMEILEIARQLMPERIPRRLIVVGVEAEILSHFGTSLSDRVRQALPRAVETALRAAGASERLQALGRAQATQHQAWDPTPLEALGG